MSRPIVAIDDGHGMKTPGKRTPVMDNGKVMHENEFNRAVVAYLYWELDRSGIEPLLTAPTDEDHSLKSRVQVANDAKAKAFVSVHADAYDGTFEGADPQGMTVFHYPGSVNGKALAQAVHDQLTGGTRQKDRSVKAGNLYVLYHTDMPACLVEAGFMDNRYEAALLNDDNFRRECAVEIAKGICNYLGMAYVPATAPAPIAQNTDQYVVRVTCDKLFIRESGSLTAPKVGAITDRGAYTIVETSNGWGRLKSGMGWISVDPKLVKRI